MLQRTPRFSLTISGLLIIITFICGFPATLRAEDKIPTVEQIVETVVIAYGTRPGLMQIRRNGLERGRLTRTNNDGRLEESSYERRFIRGEDLAKDRVRVDQKLPSSEYSLVYGSGRVWGLISGSMFTPREETKINFLADMYHDLDALLRYKENKSTITFVSKDKQKNLDLWIVDLVDADKRRTRYYISSKTYRVLWLEYEEPSAAGGTTDKFRKAFHDYRFAQGTLVPFRTVLFQNDNQILETRILTVTYGVKMDETMFQATEPSTAAVQ